MPLVVRIQFAVVIDLRFTTLLKRLVPAGTRESQYICINPADDSATRSLGLIQVEHWSSSGQRGEPFN